MTDDELRAECIKFFADSQGWEVERVNVDSDALAVIVAFAKRQQAVGLREAKDKIVYSMKIGSEMPMREQVIDWLESQAEEREG